MRLAVVFAVVVLAACPPERFVVGAACNADADCATGLICVAGRCATAAVGDDVDGGVVVFFLAPNADAIFELRQFDFGDPDGSFAPMLALTSLRP